MTTQPAVRILLVDPVQARGNKRVHALALEGWHPAIVPQASDAQSTLEQYRVDVLILGDASAPELELLRDLRNGDIQHAERSTKAVVLGVDSESTAITALSSGADVILPSSASESLIVAGVRNADRRLRIGRRQTSQLGDIAVDREFRQVTVAGKSFTTTNREFDLLAAVTSENRRVWSRNELAMGCGDH